MTPWTWTCRNCGYQGAPRQEWKASAAGIVLSALVLFGLPVPLWAGMVLWGDGGDNPRLTVGTVAMLTIAVSLGAYLVLRRRLTTCPRCHTPAGST